MRHITINQQTNGFGMLQVLPVRKTNPRFAVLLALMHREHSKYGFNLYASGYGDGLHEAFINGQSFGCFFIEPAKRRALGLASGLVGAVPLTKFTYTGECDWKEIGKNSKDEVKACLWGALTRELYALGVKFVRETVASATVENTRHILEPLKYPDMVCAGTQYLNPKELRAGLSLKNMTGRGYITFYGFNPSVYKRWSTQSPVTMSSPDFERIFKFERFDEGHVRNTHRIYGWEKRAGVYSAMVSGQVLTPTDLIDRRLQLAKELQR